MTLTFHHQFSTLETAYQYLQDCGLQFEGPNPTYPQQEYWTRREGSEILETASLLNSERTGKVYVTGYVHEEPN